MLASIHFDDKLLLSTNKIHNIGPNRFLADELKTTQTTIAQRESKLRFCNGGLSTQAPLETNGSPPRSAQGSPLTPTLSPFGHPRDASVAGTPADGEREETELAATPGTMAREGVGYFSVPRSIAAVATAE
jgi:hypothetical protein